MALLRLSKSEQNLALLAGTPSRQVPVYPGLRVLIGQMTPPPANGTGMFLGTHQILFQHCRSGPVQYFAGYLIEKSLSADNLFAFVINMTAFAVPERHQQNR